MFKRFFCIALTCVVVFLCFPVFAFSAPGNLSARSAVLINADTLEVVYALNEREKRGMASTTKIMTSLLAIESKKLSSVFSVPKEAVLVEGTSIGLRAGDKISLLSLVYGMLLESGNDAANAAAFAVSGGITKFLKLMNERAEELGMTDTSFENPSGLTSDNHYSTAYDMALLAAAALKNPVFLKICSEKSYRASYGNPESVHVFSNHNKLLSSYEGAVGVKTGFTKKSGRCLVSAAKRNGVTLVAVTLNAYDDWNDHKKMLDYGFEVIKAYDFSAKTEGIKIPVIGSSKKSVGTAVSGGSSFPYYSESYVKNIKVKIYCKQFLYAPVEIGECVGQVIVTDKSNKAIFIADIVSTENAGCITKETVIKLSFFERLKKFIKGLSQRQT